MSNQNLSWTNIFYRNSEQLNSIEYQWPEIGEKTKKSVQQNISSASSPQAASSITQAAYLNVTLYQKDADQRTRDEICAERMEQKIHKAEAKQRENYQQQLNATRCQNASDKLKTIDERMMSKLTISNSSYSNSNEMELSNRNRFRPLELADFIVETKRNNKKATNFKYMKSNDVTKEQKKPQPKKGKQHEIPKKKHLTPLKKSILVSRETRNGKEVNTDKVNKAEELNCKSHSPPNETESLANSSDEIPPEVNQIQFSRKFRSYCTNYITPEICELAELILRDLFRFQDRAYQRNEIKARATKRFVVGFNETNRQLQINKIKLLIIAPDLEKSEGIYENIQSMQTKCKETATPIVYGINRYRIGHILLKKVPVACVGIINYDGTEANVQQLLLLVERERERMEQLDK